MVQGVLDDRERELATQEKLVQRLSRSLQERDQQLTDQLANQPDHAGLIDSLRTQLRDKDKQVEVRWTRKKYAPILITWIFQFARHEVHVMIKKLKEILLFHIGSSL